VAPTNHIFVLELDYSIDIYISINHELIKQQAISIYQYA